MPLLDFHIDATDGVFIGPSNVLGPPDSLGPPGPPKEGDVSWDEAGDAQVFVGGRRLPWPQVHPHSPPPRNPREIIDESTGRIRNHTPVDVAVVYLDGVVLRLRGEVAALAGLGAFNQEGLKGLASSLDLVSGAVTDLGSKFRDLREDNNDVRNELAKDQRLIDDLRKVAADEILIRSRLETAHDSLRTEHVALKAEHERLRREFDGLREIIKNIANLTVQDLWKAGSL